MNSAKELFEFLEKHKELADGILTKLFENISGNHGDHELTSEEKKRIKEFVIEFMRRFHPDNLNRLKNLKREDLEAIAKKGNAALDILG